MKCPCCGTEVPDIDVLFLLQIELSPLKEEVLKALIDVYPRGLAMNELIERVYLHRDEPEQASRCIKVTISSLRVILPKHGWTILSLRNSHGAKYRLVALPQVEQS